MEARIERSVTVQASDAISTHASDHGESASDNNFSVILHGDSLNVSRVYLRHKSCINRTIGIEACQIIIIEAVDIVKISAYQNFSISLNCNRLNRIISKGVI